MKSKKRNILVVSVADNWGGGEEFLIRLFENVTDYHFIIVSPPGESYEEFFKRGTKIISVKSLKKIFKENGSWSLFLIFKIFLNIFLSLFYLIKIIFEYKIDFILANGNFAALQSLIPSLLISKKIIIVQHLIYREDSIETKVLKMLNHFKPELVCVSLSVEENINNILGKRTKNNIRTIRHAIKLPLGLAAETNEDNIVKVGIVGSIIRLKSIDKVIIALSKIISNNKNIILKIYGTIRPAEPDSLIYKSELDNLINSLGIKGNICFCGFEKSKENIYSGVDIIVNYSVIAEAFSFTVLEAMAFKKIIIAADTGGPKEIITDRYDGFLIPINNDVKLFEVLNYCIRNIYTKEMSEIRNNAYKTVENKFNLTDFSMQYKRLFDLV